VKAALDLWGNWNSHLIHISSSPLFSIPSRTSIRSATFAQISCTTDRRLLASHVALALVSPAFTTSVWKRNWSALKLWRPYMAIHKLGSILNISSTDAHGLFSCRENDTHRFKQSSNRILYMLQDQFHPKEFNSILDNPQHLLLLLGWGAKAYRPTRHFIGHFGDNFYWSDDPTNSIKAPKEASWLLR